MEAEPEYFLNVFADAVSGQNLTGILIALFILLILIISSALVSISEKAFFLVKPSQIDDLEKSGLKGYRLVLKLLEKPADLMATLLITINMINISIVVVAAFISLSIFRVFENPFFSGLIFVVFTTLVLIITGEIIPKYYIRHLSPSFLKIMSRPLTLTGKIFYPVSRLLVRSSWFMQNRFSKRTDISISELSNALELNENEVLDEKNILRGIVKFGDIYVREIMTSRVDVVAVDNNTDFKGLISVIIESGYSRIPVYENNFDNIKGILYIKDLIPYLGKPAGFDWKKLIRVPYFVPETKKIDDLLKEFQKNKIHMAIVVDEYGGSSGIITLEDILEEIVGEITDETDEDEELYSKIDQNNYLFEGKVYLNDFYKIIDADESIFEEIKGDADTLAGLILEIKGEFPRKNEVIRYKDFEFRIISVDSRRIRKIQVTIKNYKEKKGDK